MHSFKTRVLKLFLIHSDPASWTIFIKNNHHQNSPVLELWKFTPVLTYLQTSIPEINFCDQPRICNFSRSTEWIKPDTREPYPPRGNIFWTNPGNQQPVTQVMHSGGFTSLEEKAQKVTVFVSSSSWVGGKKTATVWALLVGKWTADSHLMWLQFRGDCLL